MEAKFVFADVLVQVQSKLSLWELAPLLLQFNLRYNCELLTSKFNDDNQES